ncbi:FHA domain-containing protein [bacterium]|nr:FHA domain-containing protein [bacterium]
MMDDEKTLLVGTDDAVADESGDDSAGGASEPCPHCGAIEIDSDGYCATCGLYRASGEFVKLEPDALPKGDVLARLILPDDIAMEFPAGKFGVGRADTDIIIPDPYVSRSHAEIEISDDGIAIIDLGSTNGTFINDERLSEGERRELIAGDFLKFGKTEIGWEFLGSETDEEAAATEDSPVEDAESADEETAEEEGAAAESGDEPETGIPAEASGAEATAEADAEAEADEMDAEAEPHYSWQLRCTSRMLDMIMLADGKTILGRKEGRSDVVVSGDGYISSAHLNIEIEDDQVHVTDMQSTNGTFIGGEKMDPIVPIRISEGAEIRIGETEFVLERIGEAASDEDEPEDGELQS